MNEQVLQDKEMKAADMLEQQYSTRKAIADKNTRAVQAPTPPKERAASQPSWGRSVHTTAMHSDGGPSHGVVENLARMPADASETAYLAVQALKSKIEAALKATTETWGATHPTVCNIQLQLTNMMDETQVIADQIKYCESTRSTYATHVNLHANQMISRDVEYVCARCARAGGTCWASQCVHTCFACDAQTGHKPDCIMKAATIELMPAIQGATAAMYTTALEQPFYDELLGRAVRTNEPEVPKELVAALQGIQSEWQDAEDATSTSHEATDDRVAEVVSGNATGIEQQAGARSSSTQRTRLSQAATMQLQHCNKRTR